MIGEEKMKKIGLIIPYFGVLPNYFSLWLKSAAYNNSIDYLLFTDCDLSIYDIPPNVISIYMTFREVKQRVARFISFPFVLDTPYKLCDYKPIYGLIFEDYLKEYDYWGHCDPDVIWGDLSDYIKDELFEKYDRLYRRGHLCIYKNNQLINYAPLKKLDGSKISYEDIYKHRYSAHYDEGALLEELIRQQGGKQWDEDDFADVSYFYKQFILVKHNKLCENVTAFRWKEGKLIGLGINGDLEKEKEYSYVHLQKRKMKYKDGFLGDDFLITPNEFIPYSEEWNKWAIEWQQNDAEFEKRAKINNFKNQIKNIKDGALIFRMKGYLV